MLIEKLIDLRKVRTETRNLKLTSRTEDGWSATQQIIVY